MYEDGQLEQELKVLKHVVKQMEKLNVELSTIKVYRTSFVTAYAELERELERRKVMMHQYKTTGEF